MENLLADNIVFGGGVLAQHPEEPPLETHKFTKEGLGTLVLGIGCGGF